MSKERDMLKEERKKRKHGFVSAGILTVASLPILVLTVYTLCYIYTILHNIEHEELCTCITLGMIFMFAIGGFVNLLLIAWRELKEENHL